MRQKRNLSFLVALVVAVGLAAGTVRAAQESDGVARVTLEELRALMSGSAPFLVLDVRGGAPDQKIKGARHIPLDALAAHLKEIPRDAAIITYCA